MSRSGDVWAEAQQSDRADRDRGSRYRLGIPSSWSTWGRMAGSRDLPNLRAAHPVSSRALPRSRCERCPVGRRNFIRRVRYRHTQPRRQCPAWVQRYEAGRGLTLAPIPGESDCWRTPGHRTLGFVRGHRRHHPRRNAHRSHPRKSLRGNWSPQTSDARCEM